MADGSGAAQRQPENGTQMIFELAGFGALDGPVAGVVDTRCHFVGNEPPAMHEELDRQDAGVVEALKYFAQVLFGGLLQRGVAIRRRRIAQNSLRMRIRGDGVVPDLPLGAARPDDGDLAAEFYERFIDQRNRSELLPGAFDVGGLLQQELSASVVAEAASFEHARQSDLRYGLAQIFERVDRRELRRGNSQRPEQLFLDQPVL